MSVADQIQKMIDTLETAKADAVKVDNGNKSAGTRLRQTMQDIKAATLVVRKSVLEVRPPKPAKA